MPSDTPPQNRLLSIHGMTVDARGRVWGIDDGKLAGHSIPEGGAKVVGFEPATGKFVANVVLRAPAMLSDGHMKDLRIDLTHGAQGMAYIADSSFGTTPAIVVVDIANGAQRRVLTHHPSTQPVPGFMVVLEGRALQYNHAQPFVAHQLPGVRRRRRGAQPGRQPLLLSNFEHDSILRRETDGSYRVMVRDPRIVWPDGLCATRQHLYCTLGQWNRLASFNNGHDLRRPPYLLIRIPLEGTQTLNAFSREAPNSPDPLAED